VIFEDGDHYRYWQPNNLQRNRRFKTVINGHYCSTTISYFDHLILIIMGNLLYVIAVILVIIWAIGFFGYHAGGIIHVLIVVAIVLFLLKVIRREA
jgi:Family of unknown function (DUF5670)